MEKGQAIDKIIVFLAQHENRKKEHDFDALASKLEIPIELTKMCFNTMFYSRGFIAGPPALKNAVIKITDAGLKYAHELEDEHYKNTGKLLFSTYAKSLPILEVCEELFQMHRNDDYRVIWTKETYKGRPENLGVAREVLLKENIIYSKVSGAEITYLNPELFEISSYQEARQILKKEFFKNEANANTTFFTTEEKIEVSRKIDEALELLEKLGLGQQVLFEELEELKNINLNKKNWTQLLKGKLIDLLSKEVLSKKTAVALYEIISKSIDADRLILP